VRIGARARVQRLGLYDRTFRFTGNN